MRMRWIGSAYAFLWVAMGGWLSIVFQTLLFRDFLTAFENNEFAWAAFFCSWLVWAALGAALGRVAVWVRILPTLFPLLLVLYAPAFFWQREIILGVREWLGLAAYQVFPLGDMFRAVWRVNAPVSLLTGFLFPLACRWVQDRFRLPVAGVYIAETAGCVAGGVGVTLLLANGYMTFPQDDMRQWTRLLPRDEFLGRMVTPQAKYLYGRQAEQWHVLCGNGVIETFPDKERAAEVLALHGAQHPDARRLLVTGNGGLPLAAPWVARGADFTAVCLYSDPDLLTLWRERLGARLPAGLETPREDARRWLLSGNRRFDLIVVNVPNLVSLADNRLLTREFFELLKPHLARGGLVGVCVAGGENYLGNAGALLGASVYATLKDLFALVAIKPGDETWLLASDGDTLSEDPILLETRWRTAAGDALYPSAGLRALYPPDRIQWQRTLYEKNIVARPREDLLNMDRHPRAGRYALEVAARQAGWDATRWSSAGQPYIRDAVAFALWLTAVLGGVWALARSGPIAGPSRWATGSLVFSVGLVSMAFSLILMFLYQLHFGSLFLEIGLVTSLYMAGLTMGGWGMPNALKREGVAAHRIIGFALALLLACIAFAAYHQPTGRGGFWLLIFTAGGLCGGFVPIAAWRWQKAGFHDASAGAWVEGLDTFGGAVGSILVGLCLLPLLGVHGALTALAGLLALHFVPLWARPHTPGTAWRRWAATLALLPFMMGLWILPWHPDRPSLTSIENQARAWVDDPASLARFADERGRVCFGVVDAGAHVNAWIFSTADFAPPVRGYAGPIHLAVMCDTVGRLRKVTPLFHMETPLYWRRIAAWFESLPGCNLLDAQDWRRLDGVTGATMTADAIHRLLPAAGAGLAAAWPSFRRVDPPSPVWPAGTMRWVLITAGAALLLLWLHPDRRRGAVVVIMATLMVTGIRWAFVLSTGVLSAPVSAPAQTLWPDEYKSSAGMPATERVPKVAPVSKVEELIRAGKLSDHEAMFYQRAVP